MPQPRHTARTEEQPEATPAPDWEALGWGPEGMPPPGARGPNLTALFALLDALRAMVPRELQDEFRALVRELLLTLRALIDWYLERLDGTRREPPVEEIPID